MQIGNQMYMATDWASLHRAKMTEARKAEDGVCAEETQDGKEVSFRDTFERTRGSKLTEKMNGTKKAPYSYLANENNEIVYNGVTFICDYEKNRICLGDVSDKKKCITVGLADGGSLVVNRENLGELSKAIGMFSPEDANRIMRAIAQDTMCQRKLKEIDDMENSVGEAAEETAETEDEKDKEAS